MSHDLEFVDGFAQAMFDRVAWHRLGTVVDRTFGWEDAIAANLTIASCTLDRVRQHVAVETRGAQHERYQPHVGQSARVIP